jgi:hypothetical protein
MHTGRYRRFRHGGRPVAAEEALPDVVHVAGGVPAGVWAAAKRAHNDLLRTVQSSRVNSGAEMLAMASGPRREANWQQRWVGRWRWGVFGGRATRLARAVRGWRCEVTVSSPLEEREGGQHTNRHGRHWARRKGTTPAARPALQLRGRCVLRCIPTAVGTAWKKWFFFS